MTNEISTPRKIKEIIIALRMERVLTKEQIMELYLNEIYLGNGSYGITSAALNYFNKPLSELEVDEMAVLAALPKAPSTYNPYRNPESYKRRNWVLKRPTRKKFIDYNFYSQMLQEKSESSQEVKKILNDNASFFRKS